jgi:hypothetical protein
MSVTALTTRTGPGLTSIPGESEFTWNVVGAGQVGIKWGSSFPPFPDTAHGPLQRRRLDPAAPVAAPVALGRPRFTRPPRMSRGSALVIRPAWRGNLNRGS